MTREVRYESVINYFLRERPIAETELNYTSPYELLVAVILSAQCTDKRVNLITPGFFEVFPTAEILSKANVEEIFELIKSCSYPNNKAKNLLGMAQTLISKFKGKVPENIEELQELPGVGRKTANVIVSVIYNKAAIAVDTHVFRVSERIGLTVDAKNPFESEKQLTKYFPNELLAIAHHWLILHGRYVCKARSPKCEQCGISTVCKYYGKKMKKL